MKQQNITVLRKILYAVESGGQVYGRQNYSAFAGVGANTPNEKQSRLEPVSGMQAKRDCYCRISRRNIRRIFPNLTLPVLLLI